MPLFIISNTFWICRKKRYRASVIKGDAFSYCCPPDYRPVIWSWSLWSSSMCTLMSNWCRKTATIWKLYEGAAFLASWVGCYSKWSQLRSEQCPWTVCSRALHIYRVCQAPKWRCSPRWQKRIQKPTRLAGKWAACQANGECGQHVEQSIRTQPGMQCY